MTKIDLVYEVKEKNSKTWIECGINKFLSSWDIMSLIDYFISRNNEMLKDKPQEPLMVS